MRQVDIKGFEDYQITDDGRVWSKKRNKWLKLGNTGNGYYQVHLCKNGKVKVYLVHRLVAEHFIPNPDNLPEVNHKDECKASNVVENLEWCDSKYNANFGNRNSKIREQVSKTIYQYTLDGEFVKEWKSSMDCERNGYCHSEVIRCCNGTRGRKTYKNYIWKYA